MENSVNSTASNFKNQDNNFIIFLATCRLNIPKGNSDEIPWNTYMLNHSKSFSILIQYYWIKNVIMHVKCYFWETKINFAWTNEMGKFFLNWLCLKWSIKPFSNCQLSNNSYHPILRLGIFCMKTLTSSQRDKPGKLF